MHFAGLTQLFQSYVNLTIHVSIYASSLLYFHAFPLFLKQLKKKNKAQNKHVEPRDITSRLSSTDGICELGKMYRHVYF